MLHAELTQLTFHKTTGEVILLYITKYMSKLDIVLHVNHSTAIRSRENDTSKD